MVRIWQLNIKKTGNRNLISSKPAVATVYFNGRITAKKAGSATITAKCGSLKAIRKVTIKKQQPLSPRVN